MKNRTNGIISSIVLATCLVGICLSVVACSSSAAASTETNGTETADVISGTDVVTANADGSAAVEDGKNNAVVAVDKATKADGQEIQELQSGTYSSVIEGWISDEEARATVVPTAEQRPATYEATDYECNVSQFEEVVIDLAAVADSYDECNIATNTSTSVLEIALPEQGKYNIVLKGESTLGVMVESDSDFVLTLDGVTIQSPDSSKQAALETTGTGTCFVVLVGESTIEGCAGKKGNAIEAAGSIVFMGDGTLNVIGNTKHGIVSQDVVCVQSGNFIVTLNPQTSAGTGIKPVNGYVQNGGSVKITALNMEAGSENKGIKVDGDEDETPYGAGKGYILINGGELTIDSSGKGMTAGFNPTEDGDTTTSTYDPQADVFVNNGLITITTYAAPREDTYTNGVSNDDGVSPEGIEGKRSVTINGGKIVINATDDCINASVDGTAYIVFNGGLVYAHSSAGDSIDSNGTITMNGGTLIALGASAPECGIDCDQDNRFTYTGGTIVAMGGGNQLPSGEGTTGYVLSTGGGMSMGMPFGMMPQDMQGIAQTGVASQGKGPEPPESSGAGALDGRGNGATPPQQPPMQSGAMGGPLTPPQNQMETSGTYENGGLGQPFQGGMPTGGLSSQSGVEQGTVLAVLDEDGSPIVVFTVPEGCETGNVLIASSSFEKGSIVHYTGNATVVDSTYEFASAIALGNVEIQVGQATGTGIDGTSTTIGF